MSDPLPSRPRSEYTAEDWNQIRSHFMGSMLVDVHLHKLAQNAGTSWPLKDPDETPAKYIEYEFEELAQLPTLTGSQQGSRVNLLLDILKETLAFDDPFEDMVSTTSPESANSQSTPQYLTRNGIPEDFPFSFIRLSPETKALCESEDVHTLGECVRFFQRMAQTVILGGEVRHFLNSLADGDEQGIAHYLPYRPGTKGLHLPEAISQVIETLSKPDSEILIGHFTASKRNANPPNELVTIEERVLGEIRELLKVFPEESEKLKHEIQTTGSASRFFVVIDSPDLEKTASALCEKIFPPQPVPEKVSSSFLGSLSGLFKRKGNR